MEYIHTVEAKTRNFYGLPKVHKSKQINKKKKCKLTQSNYGEITEDILHFKLRPIVASPSCQTHGLSNLIDILLHPFTKHVTSYLRDTTDFLNTIPATVPKVTILASFDIESLYSNIQHALGLETADYWLEKYPETLNLDLQKNPF